MNIFVEVFVTIIESILIAGFIHSILTPKYSKQICYLAFIIYVIFSTIAINIVNSMAMIESYQVLFFLALGGVYAGVTFKDKAMKKIFVVAIPFSIAIICSVITSTLIPIVFDVAVIDVLTVGSEVRYLSLFIAKMLHILFTVILVIILKRYLIELKSYYWLYFFMIFLISLFCGISIFTLKVSKDAIVRFDMFLIATICLIVLNLAIILIFIQFSIRHREMLELRLNELKIKEQMKADKEIEGIYLQLRKLRHDIKDQYDCVQNLIQDKMYEDADRYLEKLSGNIEQELQNTTLINTSVNSLNSLLNHFIRECGEANIAISYSVYNIEVGEIDEYYLCSLLSNLLNNALEASEQVTEPSIDITIYNQVNYLICRVSNQIESSVLEQRFATSKRNKQEHGFGMKIISDIVKRYDGIGRFEEKENYFIADIWLKTNF